MEKWERAFVDHIKQRLEEEITKVSCLELDHKHKDEELMAVHAKNKSLEAELKKRDERIKALEKCRAIRAENCDHCSEKDCPIMYEVFECERIKQEPGREEKGA